MRQAGYSAVHHNWITPLSPKPQAPTPSSPHSPAGTGSGRFKAPMPSNPHCLTAALPHCLNASLPHCPNGARGSFGWFDRGCLVERMARTFKVHRRSGANDETRWRPARQSLCSRRRPPADHSDGPPLESSNRAFCRNQSPAWVRPLQAPIAQDPRPRTDGKCGAGRLS